MTAALKRVLTTLIIAAVITVYTLRAFHPQQPLHHEYNEAGGVLLIALLLVWIFG